jgi:bifunctional DNA-binding transcriptional regulator/antitoxin component of YhaV-PrlF toxin-antitoxin module
MLYKTLIAAFVVSSGDALRIDGLNTRRSAVTSAAAAISLVPLAAFAELKKAGDAEIYKRADDGKLNAARTIERAKTGDLVDGSSANCNELDKLIAVDREALEYEKEKLDALGGNNAAQKGVVVDVEKKLQSQIDKLKVIRKDKGCGSAGANLKQGSDFEVYKRADEGVLSSARVIQRAKDGKLVDGSGASCDELAKIIAIDQKAVKFEKDKIEAQGAKADPAEKKTVIEAEKAIEKQLTKLAGLQKSKGC